VAPDEGAELPDLFETGLERGDLLRQTPGRQRPLRQEQGLVEVERLGEIVVGAPLHRLNGGLDGAVSGHDHDLGIGSLLAHLAEQREPIDARHADVEQDEVEGLGLGLPERRRAVFHGGDLVAGAAEALFKDPAQPVFVVGDENTAFGHVRHSTLRSFDCAHLGRRGPRPATS
jgi:hypothetical protein